MMKRILYFVFWVIFCTSCGNFLEEYSQDLVYAQSCEDLDEILIGNGYMAQPTTPSYFSYGDKAFYYPYLHVMDDDIEEYLTGNANISSSINPVTTLRNFYIWAKEPFMRISGLTFRDYDWKRMYEHIGYLNVIISYVKEFHEDSEEMRHRILGEAQFLRAGYYFMLVNLYANPYSKETADATMGVPLNLTEYIEEGYFSRDHVAAVYRQIVTDLENAIVNLSGIKQPTIYRVNEKAARALLSRVYLYMGEWQLVIDECDEIIKMGCSLWDLNNFDPGTATFGCKRDYFLAKESPEIFFTQGAGVVGLLMDNQNITSQTRYRASDELYGIYSKYEKDGILDLRKNCFFEMSKRDNGYFFVRKNPMFDATVFDSFLLRSGEIYLNKAEAQAMLDQADAINTMKELMNKRYADHKLPVIDGLSGKELIQFIREERRKELCFEGHRWFDLRRYAVSPKYPETKAITHVIFKPGTSLMDKAPYDRSYVLQPYGEDNAWVLPIPEEELVFNNGVMVDNPERIERE